MLRGLLGVATLLAIAYALSFDRKRIDWKLVGGGLLMQLLLALAILHLPFISHLLEGGGKVFVKVMDFTEEGLSFLLGPYASKANGFSFLLHSLPVVIFFSALVSIGYYWGIIQRIVGAIAWLLRKFMNISGAEGNGSVVYSQSIPAGTQVTKGTLVPVELMFTTGANDG